MSWSMEQAADLAFDVSTDSTIIAALIIGDAIVHAAATLRCGLTYSIGEGKSVAEAIEVAAERIGDAVAGIADAARGAE